MKQQCVFKSVLALAVIALVLELTGCEVIELPTG